MVQVDMSITKSVHKIARLQKIISQHKKLMRDELIEHKPHTFLVKIVICYIMKSPRV